VRREKKPIQSIKREVVGKKSENQKPEDEREKCPSIKERRRRREDQLTDWLKRGRKKDPISGGRGLDEKTRSST